MKSQKMNLSYEQKEVVEIPTTFLLNNKSTTKIRVYLLLKELNENGVFLSHKEMVEYLNVSESALKYAVRELEAEGFLLREYEKNSVGNRNRYRVIR